MIVLLAPSTPAADTVLERMVSWSASGLLRPFVWWSMPADAEPVSDAAIRIAGGERHDERLAAALAEGDDDTRPRLVAVCPVAPDERCPPAFADVVAAHAGWAYDEVLAFDPHDPARCAMIVIPGSVRMQLPGSLLRDDWSANIVVVAEDRDRASAVNELGVRLGSMQAHAAHAIATLTGLWHGAHEEAEALTEVAAGPAGEMTARARPVRCFSRLIEFGYLADQVAAGAFELTDDGWPNPDDERYERTTEPGPYLDDLVVRFLREHDAALGLTPWTPERPEPRRKLGILDALRWMWNELKARVRRLPHEITDQVAEAVHDGIAERLSQKWPDLPFDIKRWRDKAGNIAPERVAEDLNTILPTPDGPFGQTWRELVATTIGLADGADLPHGWDERLRDNEFRVLVADPVALVPEPRSGAWAGLGAPQLRACDPRGVRRALREFEESAADDGESAGIPSDVAEEIETSSAAFVWRIGASLAAALATAESFEPEPEPPPAPTPEEVEAAEHEQRQNERRERRRRRWRRIRRAATVLLGIGAIAAGFVFLPLIAAVAIVLLLPFIGLSRAVRAALVFLIRRQEAEINAEQELLDILNPLRERAIRRGDTRRLRRRYAEYLDWAEMLGHVVHHPWAEERLRRLDLDAPVDPALLPAAMNVGIATGGRAFDHLVAESRDRVFQPAWMRDVFDGVVRQTDEAETERDRVFGGDGTRRRAAFGDQSSDPDSPRHRLLDAFRRGDARRLRDSPLTARVLRFLDGVPLDAVADGVVAPESGREPLTPSLSWFAPPEDLAELAESLRPSVVRLSCIEGDTVAGGSGVVLAGKAGLVATARHVVEGADEVVVELLDGRRLPASILRVSPHTDVAVLNVDGLEDMSGVPLASDNAIAQGDPVITLGHPLLQEGEPSLAWGIVAATERIITLRDAPPGAERFRVLQATYQALGGSSGAPVLDLDGRLVGIHSAGPLEGESTGIPEYLRSAVPVADLRPLLDDAGADTVALDAAGDGEAEGQTVETIRAFLGDLRPAVETVAFLPTHFADPGNGRPYVDEVVPADDADVGLGGALADVCGPTAFLVPVRAMAWRVEAAKPLPPTGLAAFSEPD